MTVKIALDVPDDIGYMYVNHAEVTHSAHEFVIIWARVPSRPTRSQMDAVKESAQLRVEALAQVLLPPSLIPSLIRVLTIHKDMYEAEYGEIRDTQAKEDTKRKP